MKTAGTQWADRGFSKSQIAGTRQDFFLDHFASAARAKVGRRVDGRGGAARQIRRMGLWKEKAQQWPQTLGDRNVEGRCWRCREWLRRQLASRS